jgi:hypothetical protein
MGFSVYEEQNLEGLRQNTPLLRLSDPVMFRATQFLARNKIPYVGPGADVMARCYDKAEAYRIAAAAGFDCPAGTGASLISKPRFGSDSLGVRVGEHRGAGYLVQERVFGIELTVAVLGSKAGMPLKIGLAEGTPHTFLRKYLVPPDRVAFDDQRVRDTALALAGLFAVDWAARLDFILERKSNRLCFLECDVAPLIGARSAFAGSLALGGISRGVQLRLLTGA